MKAITATLAVFGVLATLGALPAAGQAQWNERLVQSGVEFQLRNAEGDALFLRCSESRVDAGFVLAEPIEAASGALLVGHLSDSEPGWIFRPRMSHRFPVAQVGERSIQIARGRGLDFTLAMLVAASRIDVRAAGQRASFGVPAIDSILTQCPGAEIGPVPSLPNGELDTNFQHRLHWLQRPLPIGQP